MKTVTIDRNIEYCNDKGLTQEHGYYCPKCQGSPGFNLACPECKGTGIGKYNTYPFELQLTEDQFDDIFSLIDLSSEMDYGEIYPNLLSSKLDKVISNDIVTCKSHEVLDLIAAQDDVETYVLYSALRIIALEAERREETIIWI